MMFGIATALYIRILEAISTLPVIDTHEHMHGPEALFQFAEPIQALVAGYIIDDLRSAGADSETLKMLRDPHIMTEQKWSTFSSLWERIEHTAYARVTKYVLQDVYGQPEMSREALDQVALKLDNRDEDFYWQSFDEGNVKLILTDSLGFDAMSFPAFLKGEMVYASRIKPLIPLPLFHVIRHHAISARDWAGIQSIGSWVNRHITSLDKFLEAVFDIFQQAIKRGAIGLKDQSAYNRSLSYELVAHADAERLFNRALANPNAILGWTEAKPLDDFLFHQYMRFAAELSLPVQIHTGHMAGGYNRVEKANVAYFATVLELHQDVQFDLFHGNWPYMGDILFFAKNYSNVVLNFCWLYIVDPYYAKDLLKRALVTVPHSKIHGYGGDYDDIPEYSAAHLRLAREVIAAALSELVEDGWLQEEQTAKIARGMLFDNPNAFFKLGLTD